MRRFNLYCSAGELKIGLKINSFFGEACFQANANIDIGGLCPVILLNERGELYLQTMRFGVDKFRNASSSASGSSSAKGKQSLLCNARSESILGNLGNGQSHGSAGAHTWTPWAELLEKQKKCVIVARGFYIWHNTEILDPIRKKVTVDKQPYYVQPNPVLEGDFFFIAALYRTVKTHRGYSYSTVALTQAAVDERFAGYVRRTPVLMTRKQATEWLRRDCPTHEFLARAQNLKIQTLPFLKIGLWLNESSQYKHEHEVLRPREEWDRELEALKQWQRMGLDDADFPFDAIEKEALKQNSANKMGIAYAKTNWDDLDHNHNHKHSHNNGKTEELVTSADDDHELKQDAVQQQQQQLKNVSGRKRLRDVPKESDGTHTHGLSAPPPKKQKVSLDENLYLFEDEDSPPPSPSFDAQSKNKIPFRRST